MDKKRCEHVPSAEFRIWPGVGRKPVYQRQCTKRACGKRIWPRRLAIELSHAELAALRWYTPVKHPNAKRREYLKFKRSPHWHRLVAARWALDDGLCTRCGEEAAECHQIEYPADLWETTIEMLRSLCTDCHDVEHGRRAA